MHPLYKNIFHWHTRTKMPLKLSTVEIDESIIVMVCQRHCSIEVNANATATGCVYAQYFFFFALPTNDTHWMIVFKMVYNCMYIWNWMEWNQTVAEQCVLGFYLYRLSQFWMLWTMNALMTNLKFRTFDSVSNKSQLNNKERPIDIDPSIYFDFSAKKKHTHHFDLQLK